MAMTRDEQLELLKNKVAATSQADVARALGYSASAISQVLMGKYQGDDATILQKAEETYGSSTVICPVKGEIPLAKCAEHKARPFAATNPERVRMYKACRNCERR